MHNHFFYYTPYDREFASTCFAKIDSLAWDVNDPKIKKGSTSYRFRGKNVLPCFALQVADDQWSPLLFHFKSKVIPLLPQGLLNGNGQVNGQTDHGADLFFA